MAEEKFDVIVIGGGPGGYVAAIRAAQLKLKTAVVEREHLGGICLNWGCIPTKALLRTSELYHLFHRADEFGLSAKDIGFDLKKVVERSRGVAKQLNQGVGHLLKKNKVTVFDGEAKFTGQEQAQGLEGRQGRRATSPRRISSSRPARGPARFPASSRPTASGSGPTSMPWCRRPCRSLCWSSARARSASNSRASTETLGADVTVVEMVDRILPVEDEEISGLAHKAFIKQGMKIHTGASVKKLEVGKDNVKVTIGTEGRQDRRGDRRPGHPGDRHRRQCRESRPRRDRREGRPHPYRDRRMVPDQCRRRLCDRRRRRPALACPQGQP